MTVRSEIAFTLSRPTGPRDDFTMLATAWHATTAHNNARQQETGLTLAYPRDQIWMEREKERTILGADVLARLPFSQDVGRLSNDRHCEPREGAEGRRRLNPRFGLLSTSGERSSEGEERESGEFDRQQLTGAYVGRRWVRALKS